MRGFYKVEMCVMKKSKTKWLWRATKVAASFAVGALAGVAFAQQPPGPLRPQPQQTQTQSQGQTQTQQPPKAPLPPGFLAQRGPLYELRRLAFMVGQWEEEVNYAGEGQMGRGRWMVRPVAGLYLTIYYEGEGPQGNYRALGILTYDKKESAYRMWWFDDAGGIGEYRGDWTSDDTLTLEHQAKQDGRDFRERISYTRAGQDAVRTKIEQAWDGAAFTPFLEASAKKTGPLPPAAGFGPPKRPAAPQQQPPPQQ